MDDLRVRVARMREAGRYAGDPGDTPLVLEDAPARVSFRPELAYSTKPVVGPALTALKRLIIRLTYHPHAEMARQADAAALRAEDAFRSEVAAREALTADVGAYVARTAATEGRLDTLERLELQSRLARLERAARTGAAPAAAAPPAPPPSGEPAAPAAPAGAPFDYLRFEERYRGPEESVARRQAVYRDVLRGCRRVVDLGCGRGELIELLAADGVDAYGVEIEPDFVALLHEKGITVEQEDLGAHLARLGPGDVDGIVASHVVEHLPAREVSALVAAAGRILDGGGVLVLETPNPESLVAGSVNFHRDLTHRRPIHPDTLAFLCESAGFDQVEVRRLAPVPAGERLPAVAPGEGELSRHVDQLVARLNDLLYGFQDYAVVARRQA